MKHTLLLLILFGYTSAFSQIILGTYGAQQVFGAVTTLGREVVRATEYKKAKQEQEQRDAEYDALVQQGDQLFRQQNYRDALESYNQALRYKQEQYVRDQVVRCNAELTRAERGEYQVLIDRGDSLYAQLSFSEAITTYQQALAKENLAYPKEKIKEVQADQERWKKVHFSGLLISDSRTDNLSSRVYSNDPFSDFLVTGNYPLIEESLIYSSFQTLDGIAVPENTRLVIYSEPNYKGQMLLNVVGPAIINNSAKKNDPVWAEAHNRDFSAPLQAVFPATTRIWSKGDMNQWIKGSM
jgi:tetratricopeptide (TPR) repeat protein